MDEYYQYDADYKRLLIDDSGTYVEYDSDYGCLLLDDACTHFTFDANYNRLLVEEAKSVALDIPELPLILTVPPPLVYIPSPAVSPFEELVELPDLERVFLIETRVGKEVEWNSWVATGGGSFYTSHEDGEVVVVKEDGSAYTKVSSVALCDSTTSSFYFDFYNQRLYVHTSGDDNPSKLYAGECVYVIIAYFWICITSSQFDDDEIVYIPQDASHPVSYLPYFDVMSFPSVSQAVGDYYAGSIVYQSGSLSFLNDGWWYDVLRNYLWHNKDTVVKIGKKGSTYAKFVPVFVGKVRNPDIRDEGVSFDIQDARVGTFREIPIYRFWVSNYPNLEDEADGLTIPIPFGECDNIAPVCIDTTTYKYKPSYYLLKELVEVRKDGVLLTSGGVDYTEDLPNGEFTLVADPGDSLITCKVKGIKCDLNNSDFSERIADFLHFVLVTLNSVPAASLDIGEHKLVDGAMELWDDATTLINWEKVEVGTSTINREASVVHGGSYACRLDIDAGDDEAFIYQDYLIEPSLDCILTLFYKNSVADKYAKVQVKDQGNNIYLQEDGTWGAAETWIVLPNETTYQEFALQFTAHPDYISYRVFFGRSTAASSSIYVDDFFIKKCGSFDDLKSGRTQKMGYYLNTPMPTVELLRILQASGVFHLVPSLDDKYKALRYISGTTSTTPRLETEDYVAESLKYRSDSIFKRVVIKYARDPFADKWLKVSASDVDVGYRHDEEETLTIKTTLVDKTEANALAAFYLSLVKAAEKKLHAKVSIIGLNLNPTDKVIASKIITGADGNTISVFDEEVYRILGLKKDFGSGKVVIDGLEDSQSTGAYHVDVAHGDTHTDSHIDVAHINTAHDDVAHTNVAHDDVAHEDIAHGDGGHSDVPHDDVAHSDVVHGDGGHSDIAHEDEGHSDVAHDDSTHSNVAHSDVAHSNVAHSNIAHSNVVHDNVSHGDVAHDDTAHTDSHTDVAHDNVAHDDIAYDDSYDDIAHSNIAHEDVAHEDHSDGFHQDVAHVNVAHDDTTHSNVAHTNIAHEDVAHENVAHDDTEHSDVAHSNVAHGDVLYNDMAHFDTPHTDYEDHGDHTDVPLEHEDVSHDDTAHDNVAHGDAAHSNIAHEDVAHDDTTHSNVAHSNVAHDNIAHENIAHEDVSHSDVAHENISYDDHSDYPYNDVAHSNISYEDVAHTDDHTDVAHENIAHDDVAHEDSYSDVVHSNVAHDNIAHEDVSHSDVAHSDAAYNDIAHEDVSHEDGVHGDGAHSDVAHSNIAHENIAHSNVAHSNIAHENIAYDDTAHSNVTHENIAHSNVVHDNIAHDDVAHDDVAHGDSYLDSYSDSPHNDSEY